MGKAKLALRCQSRSIMSGFWSACPAIKGRRVTVGENADNLHVGCEGRMNAGVPRLLSQGRRRWVKSRLRCLLGCGDEIEICVIRANAVAILSRAKMERNLGPFVVHFTRRQTAVLRIVPSGIPDERLDSETAPTSGTITPS